MFFNKVYLVAEKDESDLYKIIAFENLAQAYSYYIKDMTKRALLKVIDAKVIEK